MKALDYDDMCAYDDLRKSTYRRKSLTAVQLLSYTSLVTDMALSVIIALYGSVIFTITATVAGEHCPDGWTQFKGSCYYFSTAAGMHVTEARQYCIQRGGHLVTIESGVEEAFLKEYISHLKGGMFWLDLTDELVEGNWIWQYTGNSPSYTDWAPGEPNGGHGESCTIFDSGHQYKWADFACGSSFRPLCEIR